MTQRCHDPAGRPVAPRLSRIEVQHRALSPRHQCCTPDSTATIHTPPARAGLPRSASTATAETVPRQPSGRHARRMSHPPVQGPDSFGNALRHVRRARQLSQRDLAMLAGVPQSRIADPADPADPTERDGPAGTVRGCAHWDDDGSVAYVDKAGRAFPAHAELRVGNVPDWWGATHGGWGPACQEAPWWTRHRSPRVAVPSRLRARQDGGMPDDTSVTTDAIAAYAAGRPELEAATERFVEMVRELLDDAGINYLSVTGRTKSLESFAAKAERRHDGALLHPDPLVDITDQIGVRVITFVPDDVTAVAELLAEELAVIDDRDMGRRRREPVASATPAATCSCRSTRAARPGGIHLAAQAERLRADPHGAPARVGRVRARHPLQGHGARGARPRPRSSLHPRCRAARARRPRVLCHPGAAPAGPAREARRPRRAGRSTRGSTRRTSPSSSRASTPTPAGRAATTTPGSPACSSSSASPRSSSWPRSSPPSTASTSARAWATATRRGGAAPRRRPARHLR